MTARDWRCAAAGWTAGVLATTLAALTSYLAWWRAEQRRASC